MGRYALQVGRRRVGARLLTACALVVGSVISLVGLAQPAHATASEVLILGSSVSGGVSSAEAAEVAAQGYSPVVVNDATWLAMSTSEFASYKALVIGDPTCSETPPVAAVTTAAVWGPAVTGNTIIIGTDPVDHGRTQFVNQGIDFALASKPGTTGAYLDLSCNYDNQPTSTDASMLDGLRGAGAFTVHTAQCYNTVHIVATHPALAGLSDSYMSGWSCSVHEVFDSWPGDFQVLAIAQDYNSVFTASDGTVGAPYILASGSGLHSFPLSLDPLAQNATTGSTATVTAKLLDGSTGLPVSGQAISFRVENGPNAGAVGKCSVPTCATDSTGQVQWSYTGANTGTDTVQAWIDKNGDGQPSVGEPQTTVAVTWAAGTVSGGYVAMGDSYSSGEGAIDSGGNPAFDPATDTSKDKCHRSAHAYAYQLKAALGFSDSNFKFVACSGAELADFVAKVGSMGQWTEGPQLNAIAPAGKTDPNIKLVTLSLGGNDSGFPQIMYDCALGPKLPFQPNSEKGCLSSADSISAKGFKLLSSGGYIVLHPKDGTWFFCTGGCLKWAPHLSPSSGSIALTVPSLANLYKQIHKRAPNAQVRVLLYPLLFPAHPPASCTVGTATSVGGVVYRYHVTKAEMTELNKLGNSLNSTITTQVAAARRSGIDIKIANPNIASGPVPGFSGHAICDSGAPWINGVLFKGPTIFNGASPFSFHPNALGQGEFGDEMQLAS
jgi:hypothetical protein